MKKYCYILFLFLFSCAYVQKSINAIHPNEYGLSEELNGRIFVIDCYGNGYTGASKVEGECKEAMSRFAYENGYILFSVLNQDSQSDTSVGSYTTSEPITTYSNASVYGGGYSAYGSGYSTTYVPQQHFYSVTRHSKSYLFVLINEEEKNMWKNYYRVFDYYTPKLQ